MGNSAYANIKFNNRLTLWFKDIKKLDGCIESIKVYHPDGEGKVYIIKRNNKTREYAVFTTGRNKEEIEERDVLDLEVISKYFYPLGKLLKKKVEGISLLRHLL